MAGDKPPFAKLLIANRGEIALRVIRAARSLGIRTVAVYSEIDAALPHVRFADEAHCIGPAPAGESYLNMERILDVARRTRADAVHPGYGFLAENAGFARACREAGLTFVGPSAESMATMGDKIQSRRAMAAAGVPIIPGTVDPLRDPTEAAAIADQIGYPLLIKASAGGGGKGIRIVHEQAELDRAIANAQDEARAAFGDDAVFVEKLLQPARHIEIQLIADDHGNIVTLGERECSIQRRRQKLIEECPSTAIGAGLRAEMEEAARNVALACDYRNAGTVEFLVYHDEHGDQRFAFLEMNTRLQVEHGITELIRDVDLVSDQIRVAAGQPLGYTSADHPINGWAMEWRITAEDPYTFLPGIGGVAYYREPSGPGVRVDSMLHPGMDISVHYDSLIAKLITWGEDREQCRRRMLGALREFHIVGIATSIPFHIAMLDSPPFIDGEINTDYVEDGFSMDTGLRPETTELAAIAAAAFIRMNGERPVPVAIQNAHNRAWGMYARGRRSALEQGWRRNYL